MPGRLETEYSEAAIMEIAGSNSVPDFLRERWEVLLPLLLWMILFLPVQAEAGYNGGKGAF
jgi:hypothetical protein